MGFYDALRSSLLCFISGIKKYVVGLIIKTSSDAANVEVSFYFVYRLVVSVRPSVLCYALPLFRKRKCTLENST